MRILVTGFEAFGDDSENASIRAVDLLDERWQAGGEVQLVTGELPVAFGAAGTVLLELVARYRPDAVLAVGEAGGRASVTPERIGVNEMDARIPDNVGLQPAGEPIFEHGARERAATLDVEGIAGAIEAAGVPAAVSEDAGRFVCNYVAYLAYGLEVPAAFVHVPAVRSEGVATVGAETDARVGGGTSLTIEQLADGLAAAVAFVASNAPV
ncbi:MAG: pyroglutamyl-peptidase I family protein [Agrococcus casei]|uniref:pyroglutamyl-peptidase I family protein n=1 Tax=Agrococcus casei TaxID=343512 RepID=UPI003F96763F